MIQRTLFWFKDGDQEIPDLNRKFFSLALLFNSLMNKVYAGRKLKFINLYLSTEETYHLYPNLPKNMPYHYNGHLQYRDIFDLENFNKLSTESQKQFVWEKGYSYIQAIASSMKNSELLKASEYAFHEGLRLNLATDIKLIEKQLSINNLFFAASVMVSFDPKDMISKLILEKDDNIFLIQTLSKAEIGNEFFLEMYKAITIDENNLLVKITDEPAFQLPVQKILTEISKLD